MNLKERNYKYISFFLGVLALVLLFVLFYLVFSNTSENLDENKKMDKNIVVFETNLGTFKVELFLDEAPITAGNFKRLVEEGFYNGQRFHRVIKDFMIQSGDPNSKDLNKVNLWGTGGSGRVIEDEFVEGLSNVRGTLAMANSGPNSGSSQFFINVANNTFLDWDKEPASSKHPVFGKVIEGMDVVDKISNVETTGQPYDRPKQEVVLVKVYLE